MSTISRAQIIGQLKKDLIGKDSHRGVTLTYSWLANQFGHFSLGFIPTLITFIILQRRGAADPSVKAAIIISVFWLVFELYNFLGPLLLKRSFKSMIRFRKKVIFVPAWKNIGFDTFTDLCFFWFGAAFAGIILRFSWNKYVLLVLLFVVIIWAGYNWYVIKLHLQAAQYPFQFRLSQWEKPISRENKKLVMNFWQKEGTGKHLFVFGPANAGKSTLCIGIATEISIGEGRCLYTTAMKLFSMFFESPEKLSAAEGLWTWRDASWLVIDDINTGDPVQPDVVSPKTFSHFLENECFGKENIMALKGKNVIWVLGNENHNNERQQSWEALLREIGVESSKITTIDLNQT